MMFAHTLCVLLAPAAAFAAAFPWALPEPTIVAPAPDNWSPAPTAAAQLPGYELFRRQATGSGNTCGYVSGSSQLPFTCSNSNLVCATNTLHGVHGCCDPASLDACAIPTTCIASTAISTICTDASCTNDPYVLRCSQSASPSCYQWLVAYAKTTLTQHGCAAQGFTSAAQRSYGGTSVPNVLERTATVTIEVTPSASPRPTAPSAHSTPPLAAIVGGTVGACTFLSIVLLALIIARRRRRTRNATAQGHVPGAQYLPPSSEIYPYPPVTYTHSNDAKTWHAGPVTRASDAAPEYPHMGAGRYGVVEVDGVQRPVEVDAGPGWNRAP
ncbi:hypothetical protein DE146DRAFT_40020 [Phaeosphaeria sp. MPI-PUGE-AT-0046c]|nr:hypothetical protein DE146DRAFT_40020 [Phaeosphaeria sp. MPI-PUGE-AT-0046c]